MNLFLLLHALGPRPRAARRAPAAGRHRLRPVRLPRPRRPDLRAVQRRSLRRRRHAVGRHAGAGGRRPPVDDHAVDRPRAARAHLRRAGLRARRSTGCCATGWPASPTPDGDVAVPAPVDPPARSGAVRRRSRPPGRRRAAGRRARRRLPAGRAGQPGGRPTGRRRPRGERRRRARGGGSRRARWPTRAARRPCSTSRAPTGSTGSGEPRLREAGRPAAPPTSRRSTSARLLRAEERSAPIVTVHDAASHALAWLGSVFGARGRPRRRRRASASRAPIHELYGVFDLLPEQIVNAALVAVA